tara:strand:- start:32 stop:229 length:198 start_codon:yes stop_codon:yes gene_type:complete
MLLGAYPAGCGCPDSFKEVVAVVGFTHLKRQWNCNWEPPCPFWFTKAFCRYREQVLVLLGDTTMV